MTNDTATELGPLLARAHILMFEYDRDGFLVSATGSILGGEADVEVRSGLARLQAVRRALAGERVVDQAEVMGRRVTVIHEPVVSDAGIERVVATAFEEKESAGPPHLAQIRAAFAS
jgi:hypothetical protein